MPNKNPLKVSGLHEASITFPPSSVDLIISRLLHGGKINTCRTKSASCLFTDLRCVAGADVDDEQRRTSLSPALSLIRPSAALGLRRGLLASWLASRLRWTEAAALPRRVRLNETA